MNGTLHKRRHWVHRGKHTDKTPTVPFINRVLRGNTSFERKIVKEDAERLLV